MSIAQVETKKKKTFWVRNTTDRQTELGYSLFLGTVHVFVWAVGPSTEARTGPRKKNSMRDSREKEKKRSVGCDDRKGEKDRWAS